MMVSEALISEGIRLKNYSPGNHKTRCPKCGPNRTNQHDESLSVTIEQDGGVVWHCHYDQCNWKGGIASQQRIEDRRREREAREYRKPEPPKREDSSDKFYQWWEKRGISRGTVDRAGVFLTKKRFGGEPESCIAFPYELNGELVNVKYRTSDKRHRQEGQTQRSLFLADTLDPEAGPLVIAEGEPDVLALVEAGVPNATTLPDGAGGGEDRLAAIETSADLLTQFDRVIIATDDDPNGNTLADSLARRFGKDRCCRAKWPFLNDAFCKDANDVLLAHGAEVLAECIEHAEPWPIEGLHRPSEYRDKLIAMYRGDVSKPVGFGFPEMDDLYRVIPGQFHVVTGIPNHGKSNFLDQLMLNLTEMHGWKFVVFSPEHKVEQHIARILEKRSRAPFHDGPHRRMSEPEMLEALDWLDQWYVFISTDQDTPTIDWILERAKAAALRHGVNGMVIDPYNEIEASRDYRQSETEFVSQLISKVKRFGLTHDVATWIVVHPRKLEKNKEGDQPPPSLYDLHGSAHWYNKADAGIVVHQDFDTGMTEIFVRKIRERPICGDIGVATFKFNTVRRVYEECPTEAYIKDWRGK